MTVDMNAPIGRGDGTMGMVFENPREGDVDKGTGVLMEFTGKVGLLEKDGVKTKNLMVELADADDPNKRATVFCKLTDQSGLTKLVDLIASSGVEKKIQRVRSDFSVNNLTGAMLNAEGFHEQLKNSLPGCRVLATVKHTKGKGKDGIEKVYANIMKVVEVPNTGPGSQMAGSSVPEGAVSAGTPLPASPGGNW